MKTIAVEEHEGEVWQDWRPYRSDDLPHEYGGHLKLFRTVHAIKFDNGIVWDAVNGFRGLEGKSIRLTVRVPMGRAIA